MEIIYLQFLKNILGIKSRPGLKEEPRELKDSNTPIKSIETECKAEDNNFRGLLWMELTRSIVRSLIIGIISVSSI